MIQATGYATIIGHKGTVETDTYTCAHCNSARYLNSTDPKVVCDPGGVCRSCMAQICSQCLAKECLAFEKKLDLYERRQNLFKAMGLEL